MKAHIQLEALVVIAMTIVAAIGCGGASDQVAQTGAGAPSGTITWSKRFGHTSNPEQPDIAIGPDSSVVVTGHFYGTVDFGGGAVDAPANNYQGFIVKYDADGHFLWQKIFGDVFSEQGVGVGIDQQGNIVVAGVFGGSVDFGGGALETAGDFDIFVVKLDGSGNPIWSERFGDLGRQMLVAMALDPTGGVVLAGDTYGTVDFGGGPLGVDQSGLGSFVAKLDSEGRHVYSRTIASDSYAAVAHVAPDAAGDVLLVGNFYGSIDFGAGPVVSTGYGDSVFVAKLDAKGDSVWTTALGGDDGEMGYGVTNAPGGGALVLGTKAEDVGDGYPIGLFATYALDAKGDLVDTRVIGFPTPGSARDAAFDRDGHLVVTGSMMPRVPTMDPSSSYPTYDSGNAYVGTFDSEGTPIWSYSFGDNLTQLGVRVAFDGEENVVWLASGFGPEGYAQTFLVKLQR